MIKGLFVCLDAYHSWTWRQWYVFFFMKTVIMFSFSYHLKTCINFQFFNQNYFDLIFKSWIICITYKKNEMIIFLAAWIDVNALIIACPLSIQTITALTIYKQNVYNALQTIRIIRHKLCVYLLFYHTSWGKQIWCSLTVNNTFNPTDT